MKTKRKWGAHMASAFRIALVLTMFALIVYAITKMAA
jgi:hypothetical protein